MKINIAHLYYDLLNLYGEQGNIEALTTALNKKCDVKLHLLTVNDKIDFKKYDFVYIGAGTTNNMLIALEDLKKYREDIKKYILDGKILFATGNSFEMFGEYILHDKERIEAVKLFNYHSEPLRTKIVGNIIMKCNLVKNDLLGFLNHDTTTEGEMNFLNDGYTFKNYYGTYMLGPILVRNPELLKYFINLLSKDIKVDLKLQEKAYKDSYDRTIKSQE